MPHDRGFDALIRQTLAHTEPSSACVDAETMAAWSEGGLATEERAPLERHLSECVHCQSVLAAMARSAPASPVVLPLGDRWRLRWFVPLAAAAAGLLIWITTDRPDTEPPAQMARTELRAEPPPAAPPPPPPAAATPARDQARSGVPEETRTDESLAKSEADTTGDLLRRTESTRPADASEAAEREVAGRGPEGAAGNVMVDGVSAMEAPRQAAPPPPAVPVRMSAPASPPAPRAAAASLARALVDVVSPDPAVRWRIHPDGHVDRTATGGASWAPIALPPDAIITAGAAPSSTVCWLVGRSGGVFVSEGDGPPRRVSFPETTPLAAVTATDAAWAVVTTEDGRVFATTDGGGTWTLR